MSKYSFDAVVFDLDSVITKTADAHRNVWNRLFNDYLKEREHKFNEPSKEFTYQEDYLSYIDGKCCHKGIADFLKSRGIDIPYGELSDDLASETICGLANRKNDVFNTIISEQGVEVYPSTVAFARELKRLGLKIGVVSSSNSCEVILEKAGLTDLFDTRVDGAGLEWHSDIDIFSKACDNLGIAHDKSIIIAGTLYGVSAGIQGGFGLVLGLAEDDNEKNLKINGADIVLRDMDEITLNDIESWFHKGLEEDGWHISYHGYDQGKELVREALCTVGNGYFGTRGSQDEMITNGTNYPATYIAGLYNKLDSKVGGRTIKNEDFVNIPNWTFLTFKIGSASWVDLNRTELVGFERKLDFKTGLYTRRYKIKDSVGRITEVVSERFSSMVNPHIGGIRYAIKPCNYSEKITVKSALDGNIINYGVARYRELNSKHLKEIAGSADGNFSYLQVKTSQTEVEIAEAAKLAASVNGESCDISVAHSIEKCAVFSEFSKQVDENDSLCVEKVVAIYTSKDHGVSSAVASAKKTIKDAGAFANEFEATSSSWQKLWDKIDVKIEGDRVAQKLIRMHMFHLLATASPHNTVIDAGIPARGLHGEAYRGHIFWDEIFVLPFYNMHFPEVSKSALMYRYRRLDKARKYARVYKYKGAMYPWQSGSDGSEQTQIIHLNPLTGEWGPDYSSCQRHVSLAIAMNIWDYYHATEDKDFLVNYGAEMLFEICRFFASLALFNINSGKYEIRNVMGPDEYHEHHVNCPGGGLKDNSYTNIMTVWMYNRAFEVMDILGEECDGILDKIELSKEEITNWEDIKSKLTVACKDGIVAQFDGYFDLEELDWDYYRSKYGDISRLDRILKSEGKSSDDYKLSKQADALMTFYNLELDVVKSILKGLGQKVDDDLLEKTFHYYLPRTSHGSTLSKVVHAALANVMKDVSMSYDLYMQALRNNYADVQGGTTGEGIHCGATAGAVLLPIKYYVGVNTAGSILKVNPVLPKHWRKISFSSNFRGDTFFFTVDKKTLTVRLDSTKDSVKILVRDTEYNVLSGKEMEITLM